RLSTNKLAGRGSGRSPFFAGVTIHLMLRRRSVARLLSIVLLLVTPLLAAPVKLLQDRVAGVLSAPDLARGFWGIEVVSLSTGKTLYSQNANKLFTPASNTKL